MIYVASIVFPLLSQVVTKKIVLRKKAAPKKITLKVTHPRVIRRKLAVRKVGKPIVVRKTYKIIKHKTLLKKTKPAGKPVKHVKVAVKPVVTKTVITKTIIKTPVHHKTHKTHKTHHKTHHKTAKKIVKAAKKVVKVVKTAG